MLEVTADDLPKVVVIEAEGYPEDEAASPESMRFRQENAGAFFLAGHLKQVSQTLTAAAEAAV